jgi:ATP-dependent Clp protease ATP-binding subunit ClpA
MFERYSEKARRVIFFFARYEASQFGSPYIETEHLLLGLLREDKAFTFGFLRSPASVESIRKQIEGRITIREKLSTSVDLPLSNECKRVLAYAAEEAERLSHKHIGTEPSIPAERTVQRLINGARKRARFSMRAEISQKRCRVGLVSYCFSLAGHHGVSPPCLSPVRVPSPCRQFLWS